MNMGYQQYATQNNQAGRAGFEGAPYEGQQMRREMSNPPVHKMGSSALGSRIPSPRNMPTQNQYYPAAMNQIHNNHHQGDFAGGNHPQVPVYAQPSQIPQQQH